MLYQTRQLNKKQDVIVYKGDIYTIQRLNEQKYFKPEEPFGIRAWTLGIPLPKFVECLHKDLLIHYHTHLHRILFERRITTCIWLL